MSVAQIIQAVGVRPLLVPECLPAAESDAETVGGRLARPNRVREAMPTLNLLRVDEGAPGVDIMGDF